MKSTGMVRPLDELGRLVLPMELRKTFNIDKRDAVEIFTKDDMIFLKKYGEVCVICGSSDELKKFKNENICLKCVKDFKSQ